MASSTVPTTTPSPRLVERAPSPLKRAWQTFGTPLMAILLAIAVLVTITRKWNAWEGGHIEQTTNDTYVRGDVTPLSTKVPGLVREVRVNDYQAVHKGDVLVQLDDDEYKAQVAQATAGVEAARAALENNLRQRQLQDAKIEHALAGIDQATARIAAAQAARDAAQADVLRTRAERASQEALVKTNSTTQQKLESAVADEQRFAAVGVAFTIPREPVRHRVRGIETFNMFRGGEYFFMPSITALKSLGELG